jgi:murein DD-endopeptidase MepM/ murein hydrolase activator NlpD
MPTRPVMILMLLVLSAPRTEQSWHLPIQTGDRQSWREVNLTTIGEFGTLREPRPGVPAHLHTGIDMKRPSDNYQDEPVYPAAAGVVISLRDDGPFAQIIIEHGMDRAAKVWTVYEHIAGIRVSVGQPVDPHTPVARFMNRAELDRHGWQFDHLHFEIMKAAPHPLTPSAQTPQRFFGNYWDRCYDDRDLEEYYFSPRHFLERQWQPL